MSRVYRATHAGTETAAALKALTPERARKRKFRRAFRREVRAMAALDHPSIARVYDYGEFESGEAEALEDPISAGAPWLAMEYVDGRGLPTWPASWRWPAVSGVLLSLLDALAHAHARDIVHRDLKPSNLLVHDEDGKTRLTVVDFGIARVLREEPAESSVDHDSVTGTPKYMAPEQIRGDWRDQGPWTDLYSVGCLAWRMIYGRAPFVGDETMEVFRAHMQEPLPPAEAPEPVPDELRPWLETLLAKRPTERFQRAADAAHALRQMEVPDPASGDREESNRGRYDETLTRRPATLVRVSRDEGTTTHVEKTPGPDAEVFQKASGSFAGRLRRAESWPSPPVPDSWRRNREPGRVGELEGVGLRLFPLRSIRLVDREEERDALWRQLRDVYGRGTVVGTVLEGASGMGKSRLASWFCRRAREVGAAEALRVSHSRLGGPADGVGPMLRRRLQCRGLPYDDVLQRVQTLLGERYGLDAGIALHDAAMLAHLIDEEDWGEAGPGRGYDPRERRRAVFRWLERYGRRRPVVLWLDDVQWGRDSLALVRDLFREKEDFDVSIVVVMTVDSDADEVDDEARRLLAELRESSEVETRRVDRLDVEAHCQLVEELLDFAPETARRLAASTRGHPQFAIQAVTNWLERDLLTVGEAGVEVDGSVANRLPEDAAGIWLQRVETALRAADVELEEGRRTVELAAALGGEIDGSEWRAVCREAGIEGVEETREALLSRGLLESVQGQWAFAHAALREQIAERARRDGVWGEAHRVCARSLETLYESAPPLGRIGMHWLRADEPQRAMEPARSAARRAYLERRYGDASYYLDVWKRAARQLGLESRERRRVSARVLEAEIAAGSGDPERAADLLEGVAAAAEPRGWVEVQSRAALVDGRLATNRGELDRGRARLEEAVALFERRDRGPGLSRAHFSLAEVSKRLGAFDEAERHYRQGLEALDASTDPALRAEIRSHLAYLWIVRDNYERARELASEALEEAREARARTAEAHALTQLGEVARYEADWERARRAYDRAARLYRSSGSRNVVICRLNRAIAEVGAGRIDRAGELFEELPAEAEEVGLSFLEPVFEAGALCAAAQADDERWRKVFERVDQKRGDREGVEKDVAWLVEQAGELAEADGKIDRARDAYRLAAVEWRAVGDEARADEVSERAAVLAD